MTSITPASTDSGFGQKLHSAMRDGDSLLCVGLDPDPARMPRHLDGRSDAIFTFCRTIVDATADLVCAFKPQIAYFAAQRAEEQLEALIAHIHQAHPKVPVILDAKRGDIGSTATQYAIEAFERYQADAVTLSPYMGRDSIVPWLEWPDRGVFLLCRTSNPGGSDLQSLAFEGRPLFERVAELASRPLNEGGWGVPGRIGLVVGATYPAEIQRVRTIVGPDMPLLIPGIGAQGGDLDATLGAAGPSASIINSSRDILYAGASEDFAQAARAAAIKLRDSIRNSVRDSSRESVDGAGAAPQTPPQHS